MIKSRLYFAVLLSLIFSLSVYAQPDNLIWELSYQGILTDTTGSVVSDGNYNLDVSLFDAETGGTELYNESHTNVPVENGFFDITIGSQTSDGLYPELDIDGPVYMELRINGSSPIDPRFLLRPSASAVTAFNTAGNSVDSHSIIDNSISLNDIDGSGAGIGDVLTYDGSTLMWGQPTGLSLPADFFIDDGSIYQDFTIGHLNSAIYIDSTDDDAMYVGRPGDDGLFVFRADEDGVDVGAEENGIYAVGDLDNDGNGVAGYFSGDVEVTGNISKGGGSFKIDHPLDPQGKYLYHSFVESPDMMNVYNGNVELNANGEAVVQLPDYFEALNKDFRYQLTAIGSPGPNLYVANEISGNTFKISGGEAGMKVSWQVTGVRNDKYAQAHRINVEEDKAPEDVGSYLYPELYNKPREEGIGLKDRMKKMKEIKQQELLNSNSSR